MSQEVISGREIYSRLCEIQREISNLRLVLLKQGNHELASTKPISLEGIWEGIEVTQKDIDEAKKSLFRHVEDL